MKVKIVTPLCHICRKSGVVIIEATDEQLDNYENGALIQVAFPHISPDIREQMITGTHQECWNKMWT